MGAGPRRGTFGSAAAEQDSPTCYVAPAGAQAAWARDRAYKRALKRRARARRAREGAHHFARREVQRWAGGGGVVVAHVDLLLRCGAGERGSSDEKRAERQASSAGGGGGGHCCGGLLLLRW